MGILTTFFITLQQLITTTETNSGWMPPFINENCRYVFKSNGLSE